MGRKTRKALTRVIKSLDADERKRVLDFAKRLDSGDGDGDTPESLVDGDPRPSYLAAISAEEYERGRAHKDWKERVYGSGAGDE